MRDAARIRVPGQSSTRVLSLPAWEGWRWPREPRVGAQRVGGSEPPRLGRGWTVGPAAGNGLLCCGGGQCSVVAGGARGTAPPSLLLPLQEFGGAVWGGRTGQGRHLSEPLVMGCHRLTFGSVRGRHCLRELMKWPGTREKLARHRLVVISVSAVGSRVERGSLSPQCRLASLA